MHSKCIPCIQFYYSLDLANNDHLVTYTSLQETTGLQHISQLQEGDFPRREGLD